MLRISKLLTVWCLVVPSLVIGQNVNTFTGDFSYNVPLPPVPSPDGPADNINLNYSAGIGVGQAASDVGLGWNLGAGGSITRNVFKIPDDFNGQAFCVSCEDFIDRVGILQGGTEDFYATDFKSTNDSAFRFPAYDIYSVNGPISGNITPRFNDFVQFGANAVDFSDDEQIQRIISDGKLQFQFKGGFNGAYNLAHYPDTDISTLYVPGDDIAGSPVENVSGDVNTTSGRLITPMYVEFFTNTDINAGITGFLDYEAGLAPRAAPEFEMEGIGAFRITDPNGNVYHYSLPIYTNSVTVGSFPLTQNFALASAQEVNPPTAVFDQVNDILDSAEVYSITDGVELPQNILDLLNRGPEYINNFINSTRTGKADGSYLKRNQDSLLVEYKTVFRYAIEWKLTAVTGPRFEDVNGNNIPDEGDKGYWVRYDYGKWTDHFKKRDNIYGMVPVYNPSNTHISNFDPVFSAGKLTGKFGTYSESDFQVYYLNRIQTATNTAYLVRALRKDEQSMPHIYEGIDDQYAAAVITMPASPVNTSVTSWNGTVYDDGGPNNRLGSGSIHDLTTYVTIQPRNAQTVTIRIEEFSFLSTLNEYIEIYDGPTASGTPVYRFGSDALCIDNGEADANCQLDLSNGPWTYTSTGGAITIGLHRNSFIHPAGRDGFKLTWAANLPNNYFSATPTLRLDKIVYINNTNTLGLSAPSNLQIGSASNQERDDHPLFDGVNVSNTPFYHSLWYHNNRTMLEDKAWSIVEFDQDYKLAGGYFGNIDVLTHPAPLKLDLPVDLMNKRIITAGEELNSGKLTLNKVTIFDEKKTQLTPSFEFNYTVGNDFPNPDFDLGTYDNWALYKGDVTETGAGVYRTPQAGLSVDAWSLSTIKTPLGATIHVDYESDSYSKVLQSDAGSGFDGATRIFAINNARPLLNQKGTGWFLDLEDDINFINFFNTMPQGTVVKAAIPFTTKNCPVLVTKIQSQGIGTIHISDSTNTISVEGLSTYDLDNLVNIFVDVSTCDYVDIEYTGNGYLLFEIPVGQAVLGGNLRVRQIDTYSSKGEQYKTRYTYEDGVLTSISDRFSDPGVGLGLDNSEYNKRLIGYSRSPHQLAPEVGYSMVTVQNLGEVFSSEGAVKNYFFTSDVDYDNYEVAFNTGFAENANDHLVTLGNHQVHTYLVKNQFASIWGKNFKTEVTDVSGNIISKTETFYEQPEAIAQSEIIANTVSKSTPHIGNVFAVTNVSILRDYPVRINKQVTYQNGYKSEFIPLEYEPITGAVTKSKTIGIDGEEVVNETRAAYLIDAYQDMGPKAENASYKNRLTDIAWNYSEKDNHLLSIPSFTSATAVTYSTGIDLRELNASTAIYENNSTVTSTERKEAIYSWESPLNKYGMFSQTDFVDYDHTLGGNQSNWELSGINTLLDERGNILETRYDNQRYSASKYVHQNRMLLSSSASSNYESYTCSGFEEEKDFLDFGGGVVRYFAEGEVGYNSAAERVASDAIREAHTGNYYLALASNKNVYTTSFNGLGSNGEELGLERGRHYRASVWIHDDSNNQAGIQLVLQGSTNEVKTMTKSNATISAGDWHLVYVDVFVPKDFDNGITGSNSLKIRLLSTGGGFYYDDLKFHALSNPITMNVYDPVSGYLLATLDENGFGTKFTYDESGRIKEVHKEIQNKVDASGAIVEVLGFRKVSESAYEYYRDGQ